MLLCGSVATGRTEPAATTAPATQPAGNAENTRSLKITPRAINALHQVMLARKLDPNKFFLRIGVKLDDQGAMRGYILDFTDKIDEQKDIVTVAGPMKLVINSDHVPFLEGITVDYDPQAPGGSPFVFKRAETPAH
jgi:Fe-S cluster assembly iron-binding protein IscA